MVDPPKPQIPKTGYCKQATHGAGEALGRGCPGQVGLFRMEEQDLGLRV